MSEDKESKDKAPAPSAKSKLNAFDFVEGYVCPHCGGPVKEDHKDDVGTTFFRCDKCGEQSSRLRNVKKDKFLNRMREEIAVRTDPEILKKFMLHLGQTVKRDDITKNMVFLTGLSAFSKNPINLFLKGESSIGKTYNTVEVLKYFPQEDVWMLGALSPTALVHSYGVYVDGRGEEIDLAEKPNKESSEEERKAWSERLKGARTVIDLQGKILVFLEAPHLETYNTLRPILSHDKEEISYKFTDKTARGQLRTSHVVIRGFPATIFCTTDEKYIKDLATRGFTVTPETETEKFKEAIALTGEMKALPWKFCDDTDFMLLQDYISWLRDQLKNLDVAIPYCRELAEFYPSQYARGMRDFSHLTALIEILALFHVNQRPVLVRQFESDSRDENEIETENYILATLKDLAYVLKLWEKVEETTVTGLAEHILDFFHKAIEPLSNKMRDFSIEDLTREYNERASERKSSDTIQRWVKHLCDIGWVSKEPDPLDKRKVRVYIIKKPENNRNLPQFLNAGTFKLENFKQWLNEAEQITARNHLELKKNLLINESSSPEQIFTESFTCEKVSCAVISPSLKQPSLDDATSELAVNQKCGDLRVNSLEDLVDVHWSNGAWEKGERECGVCGYLRQTSWEGETTKHLKIPVCEDCQREYEKRRESAS